MRIRRLDLLRYGHFTDKILQFRADARVHIVYGPNEAGKSTALSAIGDLLYGFPNVTPYNFQGDKIPMRLGAEIVARDGRTLAFHRVKSRGTKNTLRLPDDTALPDDALMPYLSSVDRRMFANAFGLSTDALRLGSRAMLDQEGEIGAALIGAASGVGDLQALQKRLEAEASEIFKPRKNASVRFWQAHARFDDANADRKTSELTATRWKQLNEQIDGLAAKLEQLRLTLTANAARDHRLTRLASVRPIINRIGSYMEAIDRLGDLTMPAPDFADRLGIALEANQSALAAAKSARAAHLKAEQDLSKITLDEPLIAAERLIDALAQDIGRNDTATAGIGEVEEAHRRTEAALAEFIADLGLANPQGLPPAILLGQRRPSAAALKLVGDLITERRKLDGDISKVVEAIAQEEDVLARLKAERETSTSLVDPAAYRMSLDAFEADLASLDEIDDLTLEVADEARKLFEEAGRLAPPVPDLERLATAPRPSAETIQHYRAEFDKLAAEREKAEVILSDARLASDTIRRDLERLQGEGEVATPEMLAEARNSRDFAFGALRQALLSDTKASAADLARGIAAFEIALARADTLADAAIRDATRIETYRLQSQSLQIAEDKLKLQGDSIMLNDGSQATLRDIWIDEWRDMGVTPLRPHEMADWLTKVEALLERRQALETRRARLRLVEIRAETLRQPLNALAEQIGLSALDGQGARAIASRIKARLDELTRSWETAREKTIRIDERSHGLDALLANQTILTAKIEDWRPRWGAASTALGLDGSVTLSEAATTLGLYEKLPRALVSHADTSRRLDDLRAMIAGFADQTRVLVETVASDLAGLPAGDAAARLTERLRTARDAQARRIDAQKRLEDAHAALAEADAGISATEVHLSGLREAAGLGEEIDLHDLHHRLSRLTDLAGQLAIARAELTEQAEGETEVDLRSGLAGLDPDAASAEREDLAREHDRMTREQLDLHAMWRKLVDQRDALEGGSGAELALQRRASAESDMAALTREWLVLRLGARLIAEATARHRAGHHVPLVERAGMLFAQITGGSFVGLVTEDNDLGMERLVGLRPDGTTVGIGRARTIGSTAFAGSGAVAAKAADDDIQGGMSEGTLDQLYLAMRLAHLEEFARSSEPVPFIGDDLFVTFDDARTALGLEALAGTSELIQPIIFTHHRLVAEIARSRLGDGADVIEL